MKCSFCNSVENRVINSRATHAGERIRRRRHCDACGQRFTTYEIVEQQHLFVIKSDKSREPFDREKIVRGIAIACRKRPVSTEQMEQVARTIEGNLLRENQNEVSSKRIGELILHQLRLIDEVAYVRFASVYRQFQGISEFSRELKELASH